MIEISKREEFYQQEYCGCVYSLRDTNQHRRNRAAPRSRSARSSIARAAIPDS